MNLPLTKMGVRVIAEPHWFRSGFARQHTEFSVYLIIAYGIVLFDVAGIAVFS